MNFISIYLLFWIYSILGWIMETTSVSIKKKKFINRGFFLGPYCPIYGTGGILLLSLNNYKNDYVVVFLLSIIICSIVEYLTSYIMELIYRVRWWDYSNRMLNINGRICLFNAICFGLLGTIMVCFLNPFFLNIINNININLKNILLIVIFIFTSIDIIITFNAMFDFRKYVNSLKEKTLTSIFKHNTDSTEEMSKRVKNTLKEKSFIHNHLIKAYSNLKVYKNYFNRKKEDISKIKLEEKIENRFVVGTFISIIIGLILGKLFNSNGLFIVICFVLNIIILRLYNKR